MYQSIEHIPKLDMFPMHLIRKDSPWLTLEKLIPWGDLEDMLKDLFSFSEHGYKAIPVRHILVVLII